MPSVTESLKTDTDQQSFFPVINWLLMAPENLRSMSSPSPEELSESSSVSVLPVANKINPLDGTQVGAISVVPAETIDRGGESSPDAQRDPEEQPKKNEKRGCCESGSGCCDACYCPRTNTTFIYIDTGSSSGDGGCCFNFCKGVLDGFNQMICCPVETVKSCATNPPCHLTDCCCLFQPVEGSLAEPLSGIAEVSNEASCCVECLNRCCMILAAE